MSDAQAAEPPKSKFENRSLGIVGVIRMDLEGKPRGFPVPYKGTVWLSAHEQALTANAPQNEADNPFVNGSLVLLVKSDEVEHARPIGDQQAPAAPAAPAESEQQLQGTPVGPGGIVEEPTPPAPPVNPADLPPGGGAPGITTEKEPSEPPAQEPARSAVGTEEVKPETRMRPSSSPAAAANPTGQTPPAAVAPPAAPAAPPKAE